MIVYRKEIDGIRALAVLAVILFHAGFKTFSGGFVGVDIFFVISGYLITSIICSELERGSFSIFHFYERRARRILPALFLVLICSFVAGWFWLLPGDMVEFSESISAVSMFTSNLLFWRNSGYFDSAAELKPLLHTWSLSVEEQYYLLFPLFLWLIWRIGKRGLLFLLSVVEILSLGLSQWAAVAKPAVAFYFLPTRSWELLLGALLALFFSKTQAQRKPFGRVVSEVGGAVGLFFILISIITFDKQIPFPGFYALLPTMGTVLLILFATEKTTLGRAMGNRFLVGVGLISYSAYLWHQPLLAFARHREVTLSLWVTWILIAMTFALAFLSWRFVERPFRNPSFLSRKGLFSFCFITSLVFFVVGFYGQKSNGFESRFKRNLAGDLGQIDFLRYLEKNYFDCEPKTVAEQAERWSGFLRCKQSKKGIPDVILLGDSHAEHLFIGLSEAKPHLNIAFYILNSIPYLSNPRFKFIYQELLTNPKSQQVILTMYFMSRVKPHDIDFYKEFKQTILKLQQAKKQVTLVGDVPHFRTDPGYCVYRNRLKKVSSSCLISAEESLKQRSSYHSILQHLSAETHTSYIEVDQPLCSVSGCALINDKSVLYRDDNHLNIEGSRIVGSYLAQKLPF